METVLLVVHVLICVALIVVVLIQRSESDGFGMGSGSGANLLSGRATANLLTRTTAVLATLFIVNSLVLSILVTRGGDSSLMDRIAEQEETSTAPAVPVEGAEPAAKKAGDASSKDTKKEAKPAKATNEKTSSKPKVPEAE